MDFKIRSCHLDVERAMIDCVAVSKKSLHAEPRAEVPKGESFVARSSKYGIAKRLKCDVIHAVYMPTKCLSTSFRVDVPQSRRVVHRTRY